VVEFFQEGDEVTQVAGEPVHSVDEQHIDHSRAGGLQRALEAGPVGGCAGGVVAEVRDMPPAGLASPAMLRQAAYRADCSMRSLGRHQNYCHI
jgi:hypothetical protein